VTKSLDVTCYDIRKFAEDVINCVILNEEIPNIRIISSEALALENTFDFMKILS